MTADQKLAMSPQTYARIGGILYLIIIAAGMFGELFVRGKLVVSGDAAATAANIVAHKSLWRAGIATDLLMHICDIPLMWIFYILLRPVNKNMALLALLFNLIQTAVLVVNKLNLIMAMFLATGAGSMASTNLDELHNLAYLSIKLHGYGFAVGLIFFGFTCLVNGYLIFKSDYLPRAIGVMLQIAGVCYLISSFANILAPSFANSVGMLLLMPPFIAELSLCLWLLIKGVNVEKWANKI